MHFSQVNLKTWIGYIIIVLKICFLRLINSSSRYKSYAGKDGNATAATISTANGKPDLFALLSGELRNRGKIRCRSKYATVATENRPLDLRVYRRDIAREALRYYRGYAL
jgi:hypothetical protein